MYESTGLGLTYYANDNTVYKTLISIKSLAIANLPKKYFEQTKFLIFETFSPKPLRMMNNR